MGSTNDNSLLLLI